MTEETYDDEPKQITENKIKQKTPRNQISSDAKPTRIVRNVIKCV